MNSSKIIEREKILQNDSVFAKDKLYDRVIASFINNKLQPVQLDLKTKNSHHSDTYLYNYDSAYENGVYKCMDNFGAACAMKSQNKDGSYTLHVSFRGTDTKAKPFLKYLVKLNPKVNNFSKK